MADGEQTINPLPAAQSDFLEVLDAFLQNEDANRQDFTWNGWVVSGGIHGTAAGLTATPSPLVAFPGGFYITETASITYEDNVSTWVIASPGTVGDLGPYLRVPGSHYLTAVNNVAPTLPPNTVRLMNVITAGGAITNVFDFRVLFPEFTKGLAPHVRFSGTEAGAKDLYFGEFGGILLVQENIGTYDTPELIARLSFDLPTANGNATFDFSLLSVGRIYQWPDKSGTVALTSDISAGLFAAGTRMVFDQDSAPTGWTRDISGSLDDRVIRLVSGMRSDGGSWTITGIAVSSHVHDLGAHKHEVPVGGASGGGVGGAGFTVILAAWPHGTSGNIYPMSDSMWNGDANYGAFLSGPSSGNTGSAAPPVASDGTWRPLHRDMICAVKN